MLSQNFLIEPAGNLSALMGGSSKRVQLPEDLPRVIDRENEIKNSQNYLRKSRLEDYFILFAK